MPTWTEDEKTALVNGDDGFSDPATWSGTTIYGIFTNGYAVIDSVDVGSPEPAYICPASSVSGAKKGDPITISGISYTVQEAKPDGTGMTTLTLKKA